MNKKVIIYPILFIVLFAVYSFIISMALVFILGFLGNGMSWYGLSIGTMISPVVSIINIIIIDRKDKKSKIEKNI